MGPVVPVKPVGPVSPNPVGPVKPVGPVSPNPVGPVLPNPVGPVKPVGPTSSGSKWTFLTMFVASPCPTSSELIFNTSGPVSESAAVLISTPFI